MTKKLTNPIPFRELSPKQQFEKANPGVELTPELKAKMEKLIEFFDYYGIDYSKFKPEQLSFIKGKQAYPNYDQYIYTPGQHDTQKWLLAVKDIYYRQKAGLPFKEAIRTTTQGWKKMEIFDFLNWLKFYDEGTNMKYKTAQVWYENGQPGYFLHIKPDAPKEPQAVTDGNAVNDVNDAREEAERQEEKRSVIEKQRQKIIGRLDSAEKLLRSPEGQQFAGQEMENLMEAIYGLKKKVQLVNKLSVSTRLYEDMIVRQGNVLKRHGFTKAAEMLYSLAQTPGASAEGAKGNGKLSDFVPPTSPPPDPSGAGQSGTMRGSPMVPLPGTPDIETSVEGDQNKDQPSVPALSGQAPPPNGTPVSSPAIIPQEPPQPAGIKEFIENMNVGTSDTSVAADDQLEVSDSEEELMVTEAQAAPPPGIPPEVMEDVPMTDTPKPERGNPASIAPPVLTPPPAAPAVEEPLEVTEDDIKTPIEDQSDVTDFDSKIDNAFKDVTIEDVVAKLENISKNYKTREQPRQLSVVDMMLDSLGLASMFPSLSEALNKSLEANNYISTRVDDILSKLRGAMASQEKGPAGTPVERPEVAGIKGKLQSDQDKEAKRKQMRKEQEASELEGAGKETPEVEMGDLAPPPAAPVTPAKPVAPKPLG
jgi:hypothetical protein